MEYYSATKKNEILLLEGKQVELETIVVCEINQTQEDQTHILSLLGGSYIKKKKTWE